MASVAIETTAIREFLEQVLPGIGTDNIETAVNNIFGLLEAQLFSPPGGMQPDTTLQNRLSGIATQLAAINTGIANMAAPIVSTYSPVVQGSAIAGTVTYDQVQRAGYYVKSGPLVTLWVNVSWLNHTGTGELRLSLPFPGRNVAGLEQRLNVTARNLTLPANSVDLAAFVLGGASLLSFRTTIAANTLGIVAIDDSAQLFVSGSYLTD